MLIGSDLLSMSDFIVQSGTTSTVWGCPKHFQEAPRGENGEYFDRIDFVSSPFMNDIDMWVKGLDIPTGVLPDAAYPGVVSQGSFHLRIPLGAVINGNIMDYEVEAYAYDPMAEEQMYDEEKR